METKYFINFEGDQIFNFYNDVSNQQDASTIFFY